MRFLIILFLLCALCAVFNLYKSSEGEPALPQTEDSELEFDYQVPDSVASDSIFSEAKLPTLKIDGKEDSDVYLQSLNIKVVVTGNIASTRYTMVFKNKSYRTLEGELTFPLPDGRSATYYALDINGRMREAVPVEKARGMQVFEEIERRKVDPGLLERVEGNNLRTRIYPIPAHGQRTISVGYEEELTLERGLLYYRLPMAYKDSLEKFNVQVSVLKSGQRPLVPKSDNELRFDVAGGAYTAAFAHNNYRPERALIFALPSPPDVPQVMMQSAEGSHYFMASVTPKMGKRKKQWNDDLAVVWDVSLSGSQRNLQQELDMLNLIFAEKKDLSVHLYLLNNKLNYKGRFQVAGGNWDSLRNVLNAAVYDGGTNFSEVKLNNIAGGEILFFSDGLSTLSEADFLKGANDERQIHTVVSSAKADYSTMKLIAGKSKGKFINVNALSFEKLKNELLYESLQFLGIEDASNVREVYPSISTPVYGNFSIAGISDANRAELTLLFGVGGNVEKRIKVQLNAGRAASQGSIYKIWAQKKIAELDLNYEENDAELIALGQQFGIVTRNTSLIVLETLSDYIRYGIEPPASEPDLLAAYQRNSGHKPERRFAASAQGASNRSAYDLMKDKNFAKDIERVLSNVGSLQTTGKKDLGGRRGSSRGGFNDGYAEGGSGGMGDMLGGLMGGSGGSIGGSRGTLKAPSAREIIMEEGSVRSKAEIMQVVNARMPGLRNVYNKYLKKYPDFSGKVTLKFTIAPSGDIISISIVASTTGHSDFDDAVKTQVSNWRWRTINEGNTTATIPFNFYDYGGGGGSYSYYEPEPPRPPWRRVSGSIDNTSLLGGAIKAIESLKIWSDYKFTTQSKYPQPGAQSASITLKSNFAKDKDYLSKLTGKPTDDYLAYLRLREDYANSPAFYFDMSEWFYNLGDKETAFRILTSIAELELESAPLYRLLGYKFKEYGEYVLEKFVCKKIVQWRPIEPQSFRDYALALADNGEEQAALDSLYSALIKPYSKDIISRNKGLAEVFVMEINRLIAKNPRLNTANINRNIIMNTPVDVRIVLNWNMDNTDLDLYVKDPNGDNCYYSRRDTDIGGRLNAEMRNGYGPEQFILKKAIKGKYQVYASYYNDSRFVSKSSPSTVMAEIYTKYASGDEQRQVVTLQISGAKKMGSEKIEIAEFSF